MVDMSRDHRRVSLHDIETSRSEVTRFSMLMGSTRLNVSWPYARPSGPGGLSLL